jgi:hypothetical protein
MTRSVLTPIDAVVLATIEWKQWANMRWHGVRIRSCATACWAFATDPDVRPHVGDRGQGGRACHSRVATFFTRRRHSKALSRVPVWLDAPSQPGTRPITALATAG